MGLFSLNGLVCTENGDALLTTMHGDVWRVSGFDDSLDHFHWRRFATGLNQPFGVVEHNGRIYVSEEDQLTILHDRNDNGEADHYEIFRNLISPGPGAGSRRSASRSTTTATSTSSAAAAEGAGLSPDGHVTVSQQEGTWTPQTPVHMIDPANRRGSFYGFHPDNFRDEDPYPRDRGYEPPIVWMPRYIDNSGAGQAWVPHGEWGLPRHAMLHLSHGQARLYHLVHEQVNGDRQGGVAPLTRLHLSGARTARFHPHDGQLYVIGIYGQGSFNRIRHTGGDVHHPIGSNAHRNGLRLVFQQPLDRPTATDTDNYTLHRWNYHWSDGYGSNFYSIEDPDRIGQDPVEVAGAHLSEDGHELFLRIPEMTPANQLRIRYTIEAADGTPIEDQMYRTIHHLRPPASTP